ncbi:HAD family hydrolase [Myceligenerans crystallogenes]|uniref:HAD family hydrolase n=1 Tax=Myceligenerans crystallogenes TaxID=316335 RepID=A0ABP4ZLK3_9MICO
MTTNQQTSPTASQPRSAGSTPFLIALDVDGTLADGAGRISHRTRDAVAAARGAGNRVVLATGRSLVGLPPILAQLELADGWAVASNGALLVRIDRTAPSGYFVEDVHLFDPGTVIRRALDLVPHVIVGVEDVGVGWRFSRLLPASAVNGPQFRASIADLCAVPATKVAFKAPGIYRFADALAATGVTVTTMGTDWLDVVGPGVSKASTLETVRSHLGVPSTATIAVGDGANDVAMFRWAATSFAMGQAPAAVKQAATAICPSIADDGAADVLLSLVPTSAPMPSLP